MSFKKFDEILIKNEKANKLQSYLQIFKILKLAENFITENLPKAIAKELKPQSFKSGVLCIHAKTSPAASELRIYEKTMIDYIKSNGGWIKIEKIKISL